MKMKISWLLLLPGLCRAWLGGTAPEPEPGVPRCRPQNLTLTGSDRNLLLTWEDPPACISPRDPLVYELTVLMEDKQVHQEEVAVATARAGAPHRWSWTSPVPLECVSHSVRLSSRYADGAPWEETRTLPGLGGSRAVGVFPRDQMFRVGSEATFCCVPAPGETSRDMYVSGDYAAPLSNTRLGNRSYALTVRLDRTSPRCVDVKCRTDRREYGACTFISEPPQDRDLQCETRDLESVLCRWTPGWDSDRTVYSLLGSPCAPPVGGRCSQETDVGVGRRNWTLTAQNPLGTLVLRDVAELAQRVRMYAPVGVAAARVDARSASLAWRWAEPRYRSLDLTCQVSAEHGRGPSLQRNFSGLGLDSALLDQLQPDSTYRVRVRCWTTRHSWKWGDWSAGVHVRTHGDVPDALDVWGREGGDGALVLWKKPAANQSHGLIQHYQVVWGPIREQVPAHQLNLTLRGRGLDLVVTVTAWNQNGSSAPATLVIPRYRAGTNVSRISGNQRGLSLSWASTSVATCGYIVDWTPSAGRSPLDWRKLRPDQTTFTVPSANLLKGVRYLFSVYACTSGAPVLLQEREGYAEETKMEKLLFRSLRLQQQDDGVKLLWEPFPLQEQSAFILGYSLYCWKEEEEEKKEELSISHTADPESCSLTAGKLGAGSYRFMVAARTVLGECGNTSITATINPPAGAWITAVLGAVGAVLGLLGLAAAGCYLHWDCMKQHLYPPVPKPLLSDHWPPPRVHPDPGHHGDHEDTDVPHVHHQPRPRPVNQAHAPPPLVVPTATASVFQNPSYNLTLPRDDGGYQPHGPEPGTPVDLDRDRVQDRDQDQDRDRVQDQDQDRPLSCVFSYVLLPQQSSS